ncbi:MAG: hypothetical protein MJY94_04385 [Bacteroidales bacterium]|nr:hypothetical protein [Bacteroidales bacterium]
MRLLNRLAWIIFITAVLVCTASSCSKIDIITYTDEYDLKIVPIDGLGNPIQTPPDGKDDFWENGYSFNFIVTQYGSYEEGPFFVPDRKDGSSGKSVTACIYYATYEGNGSWSLKAYSEADKKYYQYDRLTLKSNRKSNTFNISIPTFNYVEQGFNPEFRKKELKGSVTIEHPCR